MPYLECSDSGTIHQSEARMPSTPMRTRKRGAVAPAHRADQGLVDQHHERPHEHPAHHRAVDPPSDGGEDQGEHRGPPPAPPVAPAPDPLNAVVDHQQQPGQRGVAEEHHARARGEDHGVRVEHVEARGHQVGDAPRAAHEQVHQAQHAPRGQGEEQPNPEAAGHPGPDVDLLHGGEERAHRPQVAAVLGALHGTEVDAVVPHRGHLPHEGHGVHVKVDLRVAGGPAGALAEGHHEGQQDEPGGHRPVAVRSGHGREQGNGQPAA